MLQLAKKLADCDQDYFNGWVVAGLDIEITGSAVSCEQKIAYKKTGQAVINVCGYDKNGQKVKAMKVILLKPKDNSAKSAAKEQNNDAAPLFAHKFTAQEIDAYLAYTGDMNQIHQGENPVVPGIMMIDWLLKKLHAAVISCKVKFLRPVICGEDIIFYRSEKKINAYVNNDPAFSLILK